MQIQANEAQSSAVAQREDVDQLLTSGAVRGRVGNVTPMCIWRWTKDPKVNFPLPDLVINNRKYWRLGTIRAWERSRQKQAA